MCAHVHLPDADRGMPRGGALPSSAIRAALGNAGLGKTPMAYSANNSQEALNAVARQLNGRPRQTLRWMKPCDDTGDDGGRVGRTAVRAAGSGDCTGRYRDGLRLG